MVDQQNEVLALGKEVHMGLGKRASEVVLHVNSGKAIIRSNDKAVPDEKSKVLLDQSTFPQRESSLPPKKPRLPRKVKEPETTTPPDPDIPPPPDKPPAPTPEPPFVPTPEPRPPEPPRPPIVPKVPRYIPPMDDHPLSAKDPVLPETPRPPEPPTPPIAPIPEPLPQPEPVEEDPWEPQQERKTNHPFYQDMNEGEDPNSPKWESIKAEMVKKKNGELYGHQEVIDNMDVVSELLKNDEVKKMFPIKSGENEDEYNNRLLHNVMTRLRFHGEYGHKKDALYILLQQQLKDAKGDVLRWDEVLMGAEALDGLAMEKKIKAYKQEMHNLNFNGARRSVLTEVFLNGDERSAGGGTDRYFENKNGKLVRKELPQMDLYAFEVVGQIVMDIGDPTLLVTRPDGKPITYAEHFKFLQNIVLNPSSTPEEKKDASLKLVNAREQFYMNVLDVLGHRHENNPYRDGSVFKKEAHSRLRGLLKRNAADTIESLLQAYGKAYENYHGRPLTDRQRQRFDILRTLPNVDTAGHPQDVFDFALKGGKLMRKRAEQLEKPPPKPPREIYRKKLRQAGIYRGRPVEEEEAANTAPISPEPGPTNPDGTPATEPDPGENGENLPPAPAPGEEDRKKTGEPDPAPIITPPETVTPSALKTNLGVGIVSDPTRIEQEIGGLAQHDRSRKEPAKNTGLVGALRGLISPIITPRVFIRNFVQNTLFKKTFDDRSMGFSRSMMEIARTQHAGLDSSIPFEMPQEILDQAVEEGRKIRKADNVLRRLGWTLADTISGLTGFYENSDMRYAEKWFKENGKELVDSAKKTSLSEQTELGQRFALKADNKDVISSQVGETRYKLDDVIGDQPTRTALQLKIKELVALYAQNRINDEELLKQFNVYYHKEVLPKVVADKQKELTGVELSSNILRIAQEMKIEDMVAVGENKTRYQRYQDEKADDGEAMWNKLHFDIYLGKGKYEVSRGEVRLSGLEKSMIHSMVERNYKISNGLIASSFLEMAKDIVIYGGAYVAGGSGAAVMFGRSFFHVGGMLITPIVAGAREGVLFSNKGKLYGLRGKAVSDFEQVTRETASGRKSKSDAKLRPMFEKAMVDQRKATELTAAIDTLLQKGTLSEGEQKQLLQALAHAKARLTLTDLSTKKGKALFDTVGEISVAQNFIGFSADNNNAEMTALRAGIVQGVAKLAEDNPVLYAKLNDCQTVYEAQLRVGSFEDKVIAVLARDLKITPDEARTRFASFYEGLGIDNKDRKSLEASSKTLAGLVRRKAATTALFALAVSPIIGTEMKIIGEAATGLHEIFTNHGGEWLDNWRQVVTNGTIPLTYDAHGNLVSGLSPLQKDVLAIENLIKPPSGFDHTETIDGVQVVLPGGVEHGSVQGHPGEDALVDVRTGQVLVNMDKSHFYYDSNGHMMVKNEVNGLSQTAEAAFAPFARNGVQLIQDSSLNQTTSTPETVFHAGTTTSQGIDLNGDGKTDVNVNVPVNSHWVHDPVSGKYDLQTIHTDGSTSNVVEDATINSNGEISGGSYDHLIVKIVNNQVTVPVTAPGGTTITHPTDVWSHSTEVGGGGSLGREWFGKLTNDEGYETRNMLYAWKETQGQDSHLTLDFRRMAGEQYNPGKGLSNNPVDFINDFQKSTHHIVGAGEQMGVFITRSGDAHHGVLVVDGNNDGLINFGQNSPDQVMKYDSIRHQYVVDNSVSVHDVGASISGNSIFGNHADGRVYVEHPDINDHSGLGALSLQDPNHQGFGTIEVVKVGDHMTETYGGSTHPSMDVFATIRGDSPNVPSLIEAPPPVPPTPTYTSEVTIQDIVHTVDKTILGYRVEYKSEPWIPPMIPIPIRENIEKSVRGEPAGQTPTAPTTPQPARSSSSSSVPTPPITPSQAPLPPEEKKALEGKRQRLMEIKKRIEKSIEQAKKSSPDGDKFKPTPEQEEALEDAERKLAEVEAKLHLPTQESKVAQKLEKKDYEQMVQENVGLINAGSLEEINEELRFLKMAEIKNQAELEKIKKNPDLLRHKAIEIVLENIRLKITMNRTLIDGEKEFDDIIDKMLKAFPLKDQESIKAFNDYENKAIELRKKQDLLPEGPEKEKVSDALDEIYEKKEELIEAHPNLEKQINSLTKEALEVFYIRHKSEIDSEFNKIKKQIEQWESKVAAPPRPPASPPPSRPMPTVHPRPSIGGGIDTVLLNQGDSETVTVDGKSYGVSKEFKKWMDENPIESAKLVIEQAFGYLPKKNTINPDEIILGAHHIRKDHLRAAVRGQNGDFNRWADFESILNGPSVKIINLPVQTVDGKFVILRLDDELYGMLKNITLTDEEKRARRESRVSAPGRVEKDGVTEYTGMKISIGGKHYDLSIASDIGGVRELDEDYSFAINGKIANAPYNFAAVFDGMGGHSSGEVASQLAAVTINNILFEMSKAGNSFTYELPNKQKVTIDLSKIRDIAEIKKLLSYVQLQMKDKVKKQQLAGGAGTTVAGVFEIGGKLFVFNCGDSRVYKKTASSLDQLTTDHTLVQGLLVANQITPQEAETHPQKNVISRELFDSNNDIDVHEIVLGKDESLVVMCDGIPGAYKETYTQNPQNMFRAVNNAMSENNPAKAFIKATLAKEGGVTGDNISAIVIKPI